MTVWGKLTAEANAALPGAQAAPQPGAPAAPAAPKEADKSLPDPTGLAGTITFVLFIIAVVIAIALNTAELTGKEFNPSVIKAANFALFAGFYVAAQVIERILEFIAPMLPPGGTDAWLKNRYALGDAGLAKIASDSAAKAAQIKADRAKLVLGVAAVFGVLASCLLGLFFLKAIGMHVSHTVDSILTGVTIAAGTKPLHDFITGLQNSDSPTTPTGTTV